MQDHPNFSNLPITLGQFSSQIHIPNFNNFIYFLAPLEANTDKACRHLCYQSGADITITEMVRVKSAIHKNKSTWTRLNFDQKTPTIIQLLVSQEAEIEEFLKHFILPENFYGFNLNLSCPSMDIVRTGLGCALIKRFAKVQKMIDVFRQFQYPISVKLRLGMNGTEKQQKIYLRCIQNITPDFFIIHARHGGQKYMEAADFSIYQECVQLGKPIVANGDIHSLEQIDFLKKIGVVGAMIGRSALANPTIFKTLKNKSESISIETIRQKYLEIAKEYQTPEEYQKNVLRRLGQTPWAFDQSTLR